MKTYRVIVALVLMFFMIGVLGIESALAEEGLYKGINQPQPTPEVNGTLNVLPVPEPSTIVLLGVGLLGVISLLRRKK